MDVEASHLNPEDPSDEQIAAVDKVLENLSEDERATISFLMYTMDRAYGGTPTLGIAPAKKGDEVRYSFAATCKCPGCLNFNKQREITAHETVMNAAMSYGAARMQYLADREGNSTGVLH